MFIVTLIVSVVGALIALGYSVSEIISICKSSEREIDTPFNYFKMAFWPFMLVCFHGVNVAAAYVAWDGPWSIEIIFTLLAILLVLISWEVLGLLDYAVFRRRNPYYKDRSIVSRIAVKFGCISE